MCVFHSLPVKYCLLFLFTSIHLWAFSSGFASSIDSEIIYVLVVIYINMYAVNTESGVLSFSVSYERTYMDGSFMLIIQFRIF